MQSRRLTGKRVITISVFELLWFGAAYATMRTLASLYLGCCTVEHRGQGRRAQRLKVSPEPLLWECVETHILSSQRPFNERFVSSPGWVVWDMQKLTTDMEIAWGGDLTDRVCPDDILWPSCQISGLNTVTSVYHPLTWLLAQNSE
jgi:hypothetical protein